MNARTFYTSRKQRMERMLHRMSQMRSAKARKRLENPGETEPRFRRDVVGLSLGVRDDRTGEVAWTQFRSLRDALRRMAMVRKHYA